jgi:hypothetical protein
VQIQSINLGIITNLNERNCNIIIDEFSRIFGTNSNAVLSHKQVYILKQSLKEKRIGSCQERVANCQINVLTMPKEEVAPVPLPYQIPAKDCLMLPVRQTAQESLRIRG